MLLCCVVLFLTFPRIVLFFSYRVLLSLLATSSLSYYARYCRILLVPLSNVLFCLLLLSILSRVLILFCCFNILFSVLMFFDWRLWTCHIFSCRVHVGAQSDVLTALSRYLVFTPVFVLPYHVLLSSPFLGTASSSRFARSLVSRFKCLYFLCYDLHHRVATCCVSFHEREKCHKSRVTPNNTIHSDIAVSSSVFVMVR